MRFIAVVFVYMCLTPLAALSQTRAQAEALVFVQIEAQPSLSEAESRARAFARTLPDVNGFALGRGWYAIALGPYREEDAVRVLEVLRAEQVIARDSYITQPSDYGQQFWPVGTSVLRDMPDPAPEPEQAAPTVTESAPEPDETLREARASEARLSREARADLQIALEWAGFYGGAIDAAFGPATRAAMAAWQERNGLAATGVLTTRQRSALLRQYNAVLEDLGLEIVGDTPAGIEIAVPLGVVALDRHEAPFAHFRAITDLPAQVLLISQPGNRTTMSALYDIMQTLEIVPERGARSLERDGFTLVGEGREHISHTRVWLRDGAIKGFTLVWPSGDEARRARLLAEMEKSFAALPGTLDSIASPANEQRIDLISGLEVRRPRLSRSGFFVDARGSALTTAEAVEGCGRITLDEVYDADIAHLDTDLGIAIVRPRTQLAPLRLARFQQNVPRLLSRVVVAGYSYQGRLGAPSVTFGQLSELSGLAGETHLKRLALSALDGDSGGPVLDAGGAVLGMLLPTGTSGARRLPEGVSFAASNGALQKVLTQGGITAQLTSESGNLSAEKLTDHASEMTVLVSCWD